MKTNLPPHLDFSAEKHYLEYYINKLYRFQTWMSYNEEYDFTDMEEAIIEAIEVMKREYRAVTGKHAEVEDPKYNWNPKPGYKRPEKEI